MGDKNKIKFASVEELLGAPAMTGDQTVDIRIEDIKSFKNHPFKVRNDQQMEELIESIKNNGILSPVLVRLREDGNYEMISGHRRLYAAEKVGMRTLPAIIKAMTDDEAIIAMVDANVQREEILPSEKAFALKMKMEAVKRQGKRNDLTSRTKCDKLFPGAADEVGRSCGLKERQVQKYIRLTFLCEQLLEMVDAGKLSINSAVDVSYYNKDIQKWLYEYAQDNGFLSPKQIDALKHVSNIDNISQYVLIGVLNDAIRQKKASGKVALSEKKLNKYFDASVPVRESERIILGLLDRWKEEKSKGRASNDL